MVKAEGNSYLSCFVISKKYFYKRRSGWSLKSKGLSIFLFIKVWAPNAVIEQHSFDALEEVVNR
ncbi:hypothetical protein PSKAS_24580 [Peribacillus sp. N1]